MSASTAQLEAAPRGEAPPAQAAHHVDSGHVFTIELVHLGSQVLRVGRTRGERADGHHPPLLVFNGTGGNIGLPAPLALA